MKDDRSLRQKEEDRRPVMKAESKDVYIILHNGSGVGTKDEGNRKPEEKFDGSFKRI